MVSNKRFFRSIISTIVSGKVHYSQATFFAGGLATISVLGPTRSRGASGTFFGSTSVQVRALAYTVLVRSLVFLTGDAQCRTARVFPSATGGLSNFRRIYCCNNGSLLSGVWGLSVSVCATS